MEIKTPLSPGEFFDKLTILVNKVFYCPNTTDVKLAIIQLTELCGSFPGMTLGDWTKIEDDLINLRNINKALWSLEELARSNKLEQIAEPLKAWKAIRDNNLERSQAKNLINDSLGAIAEVKDYDTGKQDS